MDSGPVVAMVWEGLNAVKTGRVMLGETNPADSLPGTIRGDFAVHVGRNIATALMLWSRLPRRLLSGSSQRSSLLGSQHRRTGSTSKQHETNRRELAFNFLVK
eukprot:TRINITY_DN2423_c0_g1_i1.p1 TRINITY_DN2423_c0_g1~~TRINITY_DN2423_c0_g1_i1.p1  ORF type:complete len:103 (-),score=10.49 TRINITY_DN2423_c0_g1_i1:33-341(-)